jgi:Berberine and berberine like
VNFLDSDDDTGRVREAYGEDTYQRLAEVKAKYDPGNVFHHNKTSSPTGFDHLIRRPSARSSYRRRSPASCAEAGARMALGELSFC